MSEAEDTVVARMQSPASTPSTKETIVISDEESTPIKRKQEENEEQDGSKRIKISDDSETEAGGGLATPDLTSTTPVPEAPPVKKPTKKELQKIENQKKRELEKLERDKKKEEERLAKEESKRLREEERLKKLAEKEAEKEQKRKKLEEEKLQREKKKEEERLQKQAEKDEKERLRREKKQKEEEEKLLKEAEKKKLEEEKRKQEELKERSQAKISNFFKVSSKPSQAASPTKSASTSTFGNDQSSQTTQKVSDYESDFLPFFIQKNVILADNGQLSKEDLKSQVEEFDNELKNSCPSEKSDLKSYFASFSSHNSIPQSTTITPDDIVNELNSSTSSESIIYELIQKLPPIKYIHFYENSKPPYVGTWCSSKHQSILIPVSNPIDTQLTGFDYEYDSDLEWNDKDDEEEGEDLDEDEEEDDELMNAEDDDMNDFVEDNYQDSLNSKKKFHSLIIINKWNDGTNDDVFSKLITVPLVTEVTIEPIDPNKDYWSITQTSETIKCVTDTVKDSGSSAASASSSSAGTGQDTSSPNILIPQKKTIQDTTILSELIVFIEKNNDFSIQTLVELSKKQFKDFTKALLKNTIQDIAVYNKKTSNWDVKPEVKARYIQQT
ncbi:chromatin assembly complex, subunit p90 [Scheffersomyces amazonensis]|uniref:chromatin assembly complex, subunit p90 n=1 Tax=Scheffersomyces amazonensis TaxID=1078765 RepID=UPI00315D96BE